MLSRTRLRMMTIVGLPLAALAAVVTTILCAALIAAQGEPQRITIASVGLAFLKALAIWLLAVGTLWALVLSLHPVAVWICVALGGALLDHYFSFRHVLFGGSQAAVEGRPLLYRFAFLLLLGISLGALQGRRRFLVKDAHSPS